MTSREYWKGKRIAVIGLGPHGEFVEDAAFLVKAGALVGIYDVKSEARLKNYLVYLRTQGLANYVCGSIPADDLVDNDLIILSHEYPRDSHFLKPAIAKGIQIEYPETLFFKQAPPVTLVGVLGESGKSTIMSMLAPMLESVCKKEGQGFFVIDPETDNGILSHLRKVQNGDLVLMRIVPLIASELHAIRISPQVALFTSIPPKGSYRSSPFEILEYQTYNNFIIASDEVIDATRRYKELPRAKMLRTKSSIIPPEWELKNIPHQGRTHDRDNAALALQTAQLFKVDDETAHYYLNRWKPLKGRIEHIKKVKNVEFYNDTASVNAAATIAALQTLGGSGETKNLVLVLGGAHGSSDYRALYSLIPEKVHTIILLPGSGTLRERRALHEMTGVEVVSARSVDDAAQLALEHSTKGDRVLFSPAFEASGFDTSRKERGERFVKAVRAL